MRGARLGLLFVVLATAACRSGSTEPEAGAVLVRIERPAGGPAPDELRIWVYDGGGRLWDGVRIPGEGALPSDGTELGTVLIQPGVVQGKLRIHLRGFSAGLRVLDGVAVVDLALDARTVEVLLDGALPPDDDGDGVPDSFDDCLGRANPGQGGCALAPLPDAATDAPWSPDSSPAADGPAVSDAEADEVIRDASLGEDASPPVPDTPPLAPDLGSPRPDAAPEGGPEAGPDSVAPPPDARDGSGDPPPSPPDGRDAPVERVEQVRDTADAVGDATDATSDAAESAPEVPGRDAASDGPSADSAPCTDAGCADKSQGEPCAGNGECSSGFCADGVCCTNACVGPCRSCNQPSASGVCQSYGVGSDPELECSAGTSCNGAGACGPVVNPDLPNGELCSTASQCHSGECVDGVCCATKCDQPCQTCGTGTCLTVKRSDDVPECAGTRSCNPTGKCIDI